MHSLGRTGNSTLLDSTAAGGTCLTIADDLKQILLILAIALFLRRSGSQTYFVALIFYDFNSSIFQR